MIAPLGFDLPTAREAAEFVMQAYDQFEAFKAGREWSLAGDYTSLQSFSALFTEFDKPEPFGFVVKNNNSKDVFVKFRGTQTPEDWLSNIAINQTTHAWGLVEEGFAKLYAQCSSAVLDGVQRAAWPASRSSDFPFIH